MQPVADRYLKLRTAVYKRYSFVEPIGNAPSPGCSRMEMLLGRVPA